MRTGLLYLSAAAFGFLLAGNAAATSYALFPVIIAEASATGVITTDGTIGDLSSSNITAIDVHISNGIHNYTLSSLADVYVIGSELSANATGLYLNFSAMDDGGFAVLSFGGDAKGFCLPGATADRCYGGSAPSTPAIGIDHAAYEGTAQSGLVQIADLTTAVPEPASWVMMTLGIGAVGALGRRHRSAQSYSR
jgi:hypothetical protein